MEVKCGACGEHFKDKFILQRHYFHCKQYKFKPCGECLFSTKDEKELEEHLRKFHRKEIHVSDVRYQEKMRAMFPLDLEEMDPSLFVDEELDNYVDDRRYDLYPKAYATHDFSNYKHAVKKEKGMDKCPPYFGIGEDELFKAMPIWKKYLNYVQKQAEGKKHPKLVKRQKQRRVSAAGLKKTVSVLRFSLIL